MLPPVNRFQWRNNWNCWASPPSRDSCQYVVVWFFVFQCVDMFVCEQISMQKRLEQLSITSFKIFLSVCGCWINFSFSVWTHLSVNRFKCINDWKNCYINCSFSVWTRLSVNRQCRNDWNSWINCSFTLLAIADISVAQSITHTFIQNAIMSIDTFNNALY